MPDNVNSEKFHILMELVHQEQNFYWQRFNSFATLHATLFVLATATMIGQQFWAFVAVSVLSVGLAVVWIGVQSISLKYVDRYKADYHLERNKLGIVPSVTTNSKYSSTDLAWWAPLFVLILWLIVFFAGLIPKFMNI